MARQHGRELDGDSLASRATRGLRSPHSVFRHVGTRAFGAAHRLREFRLGNGLRLLTVVDRAAPVVSFMTWIDVGSRHEKPGKTGLAHLFEHLMFAGTERNPPGQFDRLVESAGAESNAATWVDWTQYYENLPADMLPLAIDLESDRLANLRLDPQVVATEKDVVANERRFRVDDDVDGSAGELLYATAFAKHPYRHPTIGSMKDILGFTSHDCEAFRRTHYVPNRITLVAVGDFDELDLLSRVARAYGRIEPGQKRREVKVIEPSQRKERRARLRKPTATEKLAIGYHAPAMPHDDYTVLSVVSDILFGGRSARLHRALVHEAEVCTDVSASVTPFRDPGLYELWLTARPGVKATKLLSMLDRELERVIAKGVTESELERAKNRTELAHLQALETASGKAEQIGFHALVEGDPTAVHRGLARCRAVTVEDAMRVAKTYLRPSARTVVFVEPGEERA